MVTDIQKIINSSVGTDRSKRNAPKTLEEFFDRRRERNYDFSTVIDRFVINSQKRMLKVVRKAFDEVVDEAQTPVAKGGKMRVDTGFLRASGIASLNALPMGDNIGRRRLPGEVGKPLPEYKKNDEYSKIDSFNRVLAEFKLGDVIFFGWTARYAKYREVYDGFLETALQKWQNHVDKAVQYYRDKDVKS